MFWKIELVSGKYKTRFSNIYIGASKRQKKAVNKDLREINRVLNKVHDIGDIWRY